MTPKQRALLVYIIAHMEQHGVMPSFVQMAGGVGQKSKSGIFRLLAGLEERGFIRRASNRARAIEVLRHPDGTPRATVACLDALQDVVKVLHGRVVSAPAIAALDKAKRALALAGVAA